MSNDFLLKGILGGRDVIKIILVTVLSEKTITVFSKYIQDFM